MSFIGKAIGSLTGAGDAADAASNAANIQANSAKLGIEEQRRQFDALQKLLQPFVQGGTTALGGQMDLLGLNGMGKQAGAISAIERSPAFTSIIDNGENAILQNASATGGLRGGNVQGALAQFRPEMLAQLIQQRYQQLGGLSTMGQNSAAGVGTAGMNAGTNIAQLLQQQGAAQAGGVMAQGSVARQGFGDLLKIGSAIGGYF
jgi:hypothetical protein